MLVAAAALTAATLLGLTTPGVLLLLTFALGLGAAMNAPAWQAIVPELVGRDELAGAVALNSVAYNIARAVGPALGGLLVAAAGTWAVFLLNSFSFLGVIIVQVLAPIIARDRPPADDMMIGYDPTSSFPSGHVMGVADFLFIGTYLVFSRHRRPVITTIAFIVATLVVLLTAACRIYLGYHWPTDAVGSIMLSLVVLGLVIIVDTWRTVRVGSPEEIAASDQRDEAWGRDER